jgi:hypothetical protein
VPAPEQAAGHCLGTSVQMPSRQRPDMQELLTVQESPSLFTSLANTHNELELPVLPIYPGKQASQVFGTLLHAITNKY